MPERIAGGSNPKIINNPALRGDVVLARYFPRGIPLGYNENV